MFKYTNNMTPKLTPTKYMKANKIPDYFLFKKRDKFFQAIKIAKIKAKIRYFSKIKLIKINA